MELPEALALEIEAKVATATKGRGWHGADLTKAQADWVRHKARASALHFIETHPYGPYPNWNEQGFPTLASNTVDNAVQELLKGFEPPYSAAEPPPEGK